MNLFTAIIVYLLVWWVTFFAVLPWGNQPEGMPQPGHAPGAPANPRLGLKFLITCAIAAMIWGVIFILIKIDIIDFYDLADQMMKEDGQ
ncbi:MAG: DUF1467 domain-containing protein [Alphaproteobacteria bacterium CG_4_9_14_3_um_filter_47_13]|nr:MAG: DUF1467 domain-containing protein [Alphaproteobacteria bacterium CG_4_9_14_3_um_filter_47_13]